MKMPLWTPSEETIRNANITRFLDHVNKKQGKKFRTYWDLYQWSVENIPDSGPACGSLPTSKLPGPMIGWWMI